MSLYMLFKPETYHFQQNKTINVTFGAIINKRPMGHKAQLSLVSGFKSYLISLPDLGKQVKVIDTIYD